MTRQKLMDRGWKILPHPPYSPDLDLTDFHLFRTVLNAFAGKTFVDMEAVKSD